MDNLLLVPKGNSIKFYKTNPMSLANYLSRRFDDYPYKDTLNVWEDKPCYCQKIMKVDTTNFQFTSNYDPIRIDVVDSFGRSYYNVIATKRLQNKYMPGWFCYECNIIWAGFTSGIYFVKITAGGIPVEISEPLDVQTIHPNTMYLQANHSHYKSDIIFETGIVMNLRIEAVLGRLQPGSDDIIFSDQKYNSTLIDSQTYNSWPLSLGGSRGIPDYMVDKINIMMSWDITFWDSHQYTKDGDANFSFHEEPGYPLRGMNFNVRDAFNWMSDHISTDGIGGGTGGGGTSLNKKVVVQTNIYSRVFGGIGSDDTLPLQGFE